MAKIFFKEYELKIMNRSEMYLLQPVLAFKYVVNTLDKNIDPEKTRREIVKKK